MKRFACLSSFIVGLLFLLSQPASAQERLCDPAFEDCREPLWRLIDQETVGIDVAFWFMQDSSFSNKIIARHRAGVPVRILVDPRANPVYPPNGQILDQLAAAGIPMRFNRAEGILHWKMMLFVGQNTVQFSGANYSAHFFTPTTPFSNYIDEAIYFTSDPSVVNSFKTKYDELWINTAQYANYANITGPLTRRYSVHPIDPELNFPPRSGGEEFANRAVAAYNAENQRIDVIMYRITDRRHIDALIAAKNRGVPVRLLTEPQEYRNPAKFWHSWNVDRLYMAGIEVKQRKATRLGLNHEKAVILYGQAMTIFGSSNWTTSSSNSQEEHNYFTRKAWFFDWFVNHFERKWNSESENEPFVPLPPPDVPALRAPANGATAVPTSNLILKWEGGMWAHKYDVYFGTDPNPPLVKANHIVFQDSVYPGHDETYQLPALLPGTTYYWRVVGKTMADMTVNGPVWSFTTAGTPPPPSNPPTITGIQPNSGTVDGGTPVEITGTNFAAGATVTFDGLAASNVVVVSSTTITVKTPAHAEGTVNVVVKNTNNLSGTLAGYTYVTTPPPPPPVAGEVVLYAAEAPVRVGGWTVVSDPFAAGGARLHLPDAGRPKVANAVANPGQYFEMTFEAQAGQPYRVWIRGKAQNDHWANDSILFQFSDSVDQDGAPLWRIGTGTGDGINLEDCSGCGLQGWGWQDNGWGVGVLGQVVYFATTGTHTIRVQNREDGLSIDQIVLSSNRFLTSSPGALKNDATILPKSSGGTPPPVGAPTVSAITPNSGSTAGGTSVTISGTGFSAGATVTIGGAAATNVTVVNATSITATTPAHAEGVADVVVHNADNQSGTLTGGFTFTAPSSNPAPTISSISPNAGTTNGGISVTITGTGFAPGAAVTIGGAAATNVTVVSATSITATTPAHAEGTVDVVVRNADNQSGTLAGGFTYTTGSPISAPEVVLYAAEAPVRQGGWTVIADPSAAGGSRIHLADAGAPKLSAPLASPTGYIEMTFNAQAGTPYRLWIRGKAQNDFWGNDSIWAQFSGSVTSTGAAIYRIGTTSGADINLEDCSGCGLQGWGWQDNGWGVGVMGPVIYFATTGQQTIRIQNREDGLSIDQIVLSPSTYLNTSPGALKNDTVILQRSQ